MASPKKKWLRRKALRDSLKATKPDAPAAAPAPAPAEPAPAKKSKKPVKRLLKL